MSWHIEQVQSSLDVFVFVACRICLLCLNLLLLLLLLLLALFAHFERERCVPNEANVRPSPSTKSAKAALPAPPPSLRLPPPTGACNCAMSSAGAKVALIN